MKNYAEDWEAVIGLEIHVQLSTKSKLFSGASTAFGALPNSQPCNNDLAMPGVLPFLNEEVLKGLDITADGFWKKFEDLLNGFHQRNKDLLARRSFLQDQISYWHKNNDFNVKEYKKFLQEIGYL